MANSLDSGMRRNDEEKRTPIELVHAPPFLLNHTPDLLYDG